jgi:hypothetical protein
MEKSFSYVRSILSRYPDGADFKDVDTIDEIIFPLRGNNVLIKTKLKYLGTQVIQQNT